MELVELYNVKGQHEKGVCVCECTCACACVHAYACGAIIHVWYVTHKLQHIFDHFLMFVVYCFGVSS